MLFLDHEHLNQRLIVLSQLSNLEALPLWANTVQNDVPKFRNSCLILILILQQKFSPVLV